MNGDILPEDVLWASRSICSRRCFGACERAVSAGVQAGGLQEAFTCAMTSILGAGACSSSPFFGFGAENISLWSTRSLRLQQTA